MSPSIRGTLAVPAISVKYFWIKNSHRCQLEIGLVKTKVIFAFDFFSGQHTGCGADLVPGPSTSMHICICTTCSAWSKVVFKITWCLGFQEKGRGLRFLTLMDWKQISLWVIHFSSCFKRTHILQDGSVYLLSTCRSKSGSGWVREGEYLSWPAEVISYASFYVVCECSWIL